MQNQQEQRPDSQTLQQFLTSIQSILIAKIEQSHLNDSKRLEEQIQVLKQLKKQFKQNDQ